MDLIDTHVHLYFDAYDSDRGEVIQRAAAVGVRRLLVIGAGGGIESTHKAIALAEQYDNIWASVGVHPHDAGKDIECEVIRRLLSHPRVVAIGETGLDFYREWSPFDLQREWFQRQIEMALECRKPLIIHSRNAGVDCLAMLKDIGKGGVKGVFHCYGEDAAFATKLLDIGFLVSITGSVTFKKADSLRAIVKEIPLSQLMLETDGPYMAPEPFRGSRSESAHVLEIAKMIAAIKGISLEEVASETTKNAQNLFGI